jgi:hypothetical protein
MLDMRGTEKRRKGFANVKAYCIGILCNVSPSPKHKTRSVSDAIDRILELREGTDLGGLSIKELIDEGRKY